MKKLLMPLLFLAFALVGCGDEYLPMLDEGNPQDDATQQDTIETGDTVGDEGNRDTSDDAVEGCHYQILMQMATLIPTETTVGLQVDIPAVVVDFLKDEPAEGVLVSFAVTSVMDEEGNQVQGDAHFETSAKPSGANGFVENNFYVGMTPNLTYTVTLSLPDCPETEPVSVQVKVLPYACGSLRVDFKYAGTLEEALHDIEVFVVPSTYKCTTNIKPGTVISEEYVIASRTAPSVESTVTFDCLPAGTYYTVYANAKSGDIACTAAGACSRTLVVMPDTTDNLTLEFGDAALQAAGRYNAVDHFDFSNMIQMCAGGDTTIIGCVTAGTEDVGKLVCCSIQEIVKFFNTPGTTITELVFDALELWIGSAIIQAVENIIGGPLASLLNGLIDKWAEDNPWLGSFLNAGDDITDIIEHLELESELVLEKTSYAGVQGTHYWHALNLYWTLNCAAEGEPGYDPECGKFSLDMQDLTVLPDDFPMDLLEGGFDATIFHYNKLTLDRHEIGLSYGKLVLYAINQIFIPTISGDQAHSIEELADLWLDCAGLANGTLGDYWEQAGGDRSDVEDTCNSIVSTMIDPVDDMVGRLSLATTMSLVGDGILVDDDCDSNVDRIVDGTYTGFVESANSQAAITGDWSAVKIPEGEAAQ